jgi:hypothetical protein
MHIKTGRRRQGGRPPTLLTAAASDGYVKQRWPGDAASAIEGFKRQNVPLDESSHSMPASNFTASTYPAIGGGASLSRLSIGVN